MYGGIVMVAVKEFKIWEFYYLIFINLIKKTYTKTFFNVLSSLIMYKQSKAGSTRTM